MKVTDGLFGAVFTLKEHSASSLGAAVGRLEDFRSHHRASTLEGILQILPGGIKGQVTNVHLSAITTSLLLAIRAGGDDNTAASSALAATTARLAASSTASSGTVAVLAVFTTENL